MLRAPKVSHSKFRNDWPFSLRVICELTRALLRADRGVGRTYRYGWIDRQNYLKSRATESDATKKKSDEVIC